MTAATPVPEPSALKPTVKHHERIGIIGGGGHARVMASAARLAFGPCDMVLFDHQWPEVMSVVGLEVRGRDPRTAGFSPVDGPLLLGIGDNFSRGRIHETMSNSGYTMPTLVHPNAFVSPEAIFAEAAFVAAGAIVNPHARIARGAILNTGSIVEHDCIIGEFVHLSPGTVIAGGAQVGAYTWVGAGATIIHGVRIGENIVVGAGAVVTRNLTTPGTYVGVPAKRIN